MVVFKFRIWMIFVLLLNGCATFTAPTDYDPTSRPEDGLVLVSFDQSYSVVKWMYRDLNSSKGIKGFDENFISTTDKINDLIYNGRRIIYPFKLKPGKYEFFRWTLPEFRVYYESTNDFSIQFEVLPGVVTYIGSISMFASGDKYQVGIKNEGVLDVPVFLKNYPNVDIEEVVVRIGEFKGFEDK